MLVDKRLIITGVVTTDSIAFTTAERAQLAGAELLLTAFPRDRARTEAAARQLPQPAEVVDLDVTQPDDVQRLADHVRRRWGNLDGALHAIAFAPRDALANDFLAASPEGVNLAFQTSAYSYATLGRLLRELAPPTGGALVGLDFDAGRAWPVYNWMGVCKAALEAVNRYLARDLGPYGIRTNLIAAGPLHTRAAGGIDGFTRLLDAWDTQAPLAWNPYDPEPVADTACFLLSDLARATTGEILHVDGGYHAMAAALSQAPSGRVGAGLAKSTILNDRECLQRAFATLREYGVEAWSSTGQQPAGTRETLRRAILSRFPDAVGSYIFWTAVDDACFNAEGFLQRPLTLHYSGEETARTAMAVIANAPLAICQGEQSLTLLVRSSVADSDRQGITGSHITRT